MSESNNLTAEKLAGELENKIKVATAYDNKVVGLSVSDARRIVDALRSSEPDTSRKDEDIRKLRDYAKRMAKYNSVEISHAALEVLNQTEPAILLRPHETPRRISDDDRMIAGLHAAAQDVVEAYEDRFGALAGGFFGPIDSVVTELRDAVNKMTMAAINSTKPQPETGEHCSNCGAVGIFDSERNCYQCSNCVNAWKSSRREHPND